VPVAVQQPFGQEVASQTHWPDVVLHSVPEGHAAHVVPRAPQEVLVSLDSVSHVVPLQQPSQIVPPHEHAPPEHDWPLTHAAHAPPPAPHWAAVCAGKRTQAPVGSQHPPGHEVASHAHWPVALHSLPDAHAAHALPPVPHDTLPCAEYRWQSPAAVQQPSGHEVGLHPHVPAVVSQLLPPGHAAHALPPAPHTESVCVA